MRESGESFAFETTLAGLSYLRHIRQWRREGYHVGLFFLRLPDAETAVALATDPARHAAWRARVGEAAWSRTLGDTAGFARRVEDAYRRIRLQPPA